MRGRFAVEPRGNLAALGDRFDFIDIAQEDDVLPSLADRELLATRLGTPGLLVISRRHQRYTS
eukprot:12915627-Prorocentrum_lima.AAC.1